MTDLQVKRVYEKEFQHQNSHASGQIIATENTTDFPQMVVKSKGNPRLFQGNLGW